MRIRAFAQIDVFTVVPYRGNPVAVVLDAEGVDDEALAAFARWTNLSETTFVLPPSAEAAAGGADYHVRIFTPSRELPFAGHPTLGTAHAWLEAGNEPRDPSAVVQQCGVGLVRIRRDGDSLAFAAPPLVRSGPIDPDDLAEFAAVLGIPIADIVDSNWVDNGPGWSGLLLASAEAVLAIEPDLARLGSKNIGVVGPSAATDRSAETGDFHPHFEVRAFAGAAGAREDPVTGSLNASLAQWLMASGHAPEHYDAGQGARLDRDGRVRLDRIDGQVWVGGDSVTCIAGTVLL